jgi:hypothetical protein
MTDVTPGIGFVAIQPCRVADTRGFGAPISGGIFANGEVRTWDLTGLCGIPNGAGAISANFTVTGSPSAPPGAFLLAWPTGGPTPGISILNFQAGQTIANAAIVPLGPGEQLNVNVSHSTHVILDINGYFTLAYNPGNLFIVVTSIDAGPAILAQNNSSANGSHAIGGFAAGAGVVHGVQGQVGPGALAGSSGVHGINDSNAQQAYGVLGETSSVSANAAGVLGRDGTGIVAGTCCLQPTGVFGDSKTGVGVLGRSEQSGVIGVLLDSNGSTLALGDLGTDAYPGGPYGVFSNGSAHVAGTFTATNNKGFVQPHPHDASKEIRYISLEGPHTEVYFRGTAQVVQGVTRIAIPQHFRFVADPATYSTLVTPVGGMATVAVLSEGPEGVVVQASRNVKIHYVVYAEREAVRNPDPIIENVHFRPDPRHNLLANLPDSFRQLMIRNGTLNPDGTVNMETARRLGWDKDWKSQARSGPGSALE